MDVENKLDEDFLFYLGFTTSFLHKFPQKCDRDLCNAWLQKLCGEACANVDKKRNRNIFLSNLVLSMQEGKLMAPFDSLPNEIDIGNAALYFGQAKIEVQQPDWFDEVIQGESADDEPPVEKGRTYVATRTMPGGEGAFAYVAISLADDDPKWLGGGEGEFDQHMEDKFQDLLPEQNEMEKLLARRKDPREREKVLTFYDVLMQNIADELDEKVEPQDNETINGLVEQLIDDLKAKGEWGAFHELSVKNQRAELLLVLFERINSRRQKIAKREEILDEIEQKVMPRSFFENTMEADDKYELPSAMWEQAINKAPNKRHMEMLQANYPLPLIEKFLEYQSNYKEEIAIRLQKRHEHIVSQMRRELRKEGEIGLKKMEDAQVSCDQAMAVLKAVRGAKNSQLESEKAIKPRRKGGITAKTKLYEEMRQAIVETQRNVEEESLKGRFLTDQINAVNEQTEVYQQVTEDSIIKMEEANMALMRNIKRLGKAVTAHEGTVKQLKCMVAKKAQHGQQAFYV